MKVAIFAVQYKVKFNEYPTTLNKEFQESFRNEFFNELIIQARSEKVNLALLPDGFFRSDYPDRIVKFLKRNSPKINVLVGRDNTSGSKLEVLLVSPSGRIRKKIVEVYDQYKRARKNKSKKKAILQGIRDRRFQINNKMYTVYSCGDVLVSEIRKASPLTYCKAAFVLAHYTARRFSSSMRKVGIPIFLSHHLKNPWSS
ncbi:hypothetical protein B9J77_04125 [candidate division NPL-UPA2 bacterium Unc8]|uniref:Uncharacterized protein n=2 Tax=Bacteria TaxID=2 RepID=A0A9E2F6V4_PSYF1|nr:hypothetical protein [Candidatus Psychracetigena formicireducens]RIH99927.1 MAG: hypothetical protein B9J77_04125 [candidate division NPL-UPA2 bacterium Unc8]